MAGAPWFAFLVHPRHVGDIDTFAGASIVRAHSRSEREYVAKSARTRR
jgi:hypothetical protein